MCGFIGLYKKTEGLTDTEKNTVAAMNARIAHRGPDQDACVSYPMAAFGFRRLSIIDIAGGDQPFETPDGRYTAVYNGEVYNYLELRDELVKNGEQFETRSEIEVMLRMYSIYGPSFISRLRGMFAFLIYDREKHTIMAGRDPFGIKPLYFRENKTAVAFASEMKAWLADPEMSFSVDKTMLQHYLTFQYVTEPDTICPDIKIVPAGSYMTVTPAGNETICYYKPVFAPSKALTYDKKKENLRKALEDSVSHHLLADTPVGTFLSSGIDSAIVTSVASKLQPGIKAFTVGFDVKGYSELDEAAKIAERLDVEHISLKCNIDDFTSNFERVIYHLDSPMADPSVVAIYLICREASRHVKAVLTGEGSDELFGGYRVYNTANSCMTGLPSPIKSLLLKIAHSLPEGVKGKNFLIRGCTPIEKRFVGNSFVFPESAKEAILKTYDPSVCYTDRTAAIYREAAGATNLTKMQHCDMRTWLRSDILVKGDRLSMASSLEARVPFLDKEVFKAASVLCDKDKLKKGTTKYILRDTFSDMLDSETVMRPKLGYPVPVRVWLKDELYDWAADIIKNNTAEEYIVTSEALKLLDAHHAGKADFYHQVWTILVFITWYRLYIDGDYRGLIESR